MNKEDMKETQMAFTAAVMDPTVPKIYFNGMVLSNTNHDITAMLQLGDKVNAVAVLNMTPHIARELSGMLKTAADNAENASSDKHYNTDEEGEND